MFLLLSAQVNPFLPSSDTLVTLKIMTVLLIVILGELPWWYLLVLILIILAAFVQVIIVSVNLLHSLRPYPLVFLNALRMVEAVVLEIIA